MLVSTLHLYLPHSGRGRRYVCIIQNQNGTQKEEYSSSRGFDDELWQRSLFQISCWGRGRCCGQADGGGHFRPRGIVVGIVITKLAVFKIKLPGPPKQGIAQTSRPPPLRKVVEKPTHSPTHQSANNRPKTLSKSFPVAFKQACPIVHLRGRIQSTREPPPRNQRLGGASHGQAHSKEAWSVLKIPSHPVCWLSTVQPVCDEKE